MADYVASDVHLRRDAPERGNRFGSWVDSLAPSDSLYLVGDTCDFWYATRETRRPGDRQEPGIAALARFTKRGGSLTVMGGNHDAWLGPFYQEVLDARWVADERLDLELQGLRLRLMHGHTIKASGRWKNALESRAFFQAFRALPAGVATRLDRQLMKANSIDEPEVNRRNLARFGQFVKSLSGAPIDLVVFGHVHQVYQEPARGPIPAWLVLGNWHERACYLRIDDGVAQPFAGDQPIGMEVRARETWV